jgi:hypothetical protein
VPALAVAGVAGTSEPDPIFALIDAAKLAEAAFYEASDRVMAMHHADPARDAAYEKSSALCEILCDAEDAVFNAKPRTLAGLAAQLIFAAEYAADGREADYLFPVVMNVARLLDGPLVSKIGLSERLANKCRAFSRTA